MSLPIRIKSYLVIILLGTYMLHTTLLIDKFHVSRFIFVSLINLFAIIWVLPLFKTIRLHIFDGLLFAFYLLHLLSIFWAVNFAEAIFIAQKSLLLLLSYLFFRLILGQYKKADRWLSHTVLLLSLLVLLVTSIQMIPLLLGKGLNSESIYELTAWAGHKNLAASYVFFIFCYLIAKAPIIKYKKLLVLTLIWQLAVILLFRSRAVYLGLFSFLTIGGIYYIWQNINHRRLIFYKLLPVFLVFATLAIFAAGTTTTGQAYLKYLNPATYKQSVSGIERQFVWYKTGELIKDYPLLGCGSGNWKIFFPSNNIQGGFRLQEKGVVFTRAHNDFLEVWAELGIVGFLLYVGLFIVAIVVVFLSFRQTTDRQKKRRLLWLGASLFAYTVIAFFDFPKERIEHQVFLALLLATMMAEAKNVLPIIGPSLKVASRQKTVLMGILLLCWLPNIPIIWARAMGDHYVKDLMVGKQQQDSEKIKRACQKIPTYWYSIDPATLPVKWYEGLAFYFEKDYTTALIYFKEAYAVNPYNLQVLNNCALTLTQLNRYEESIPFFKKVLSINPQSENGLFNLSFAYQSIGEYDEALKWVNKVEKNLERKAVFIREINNKRLKQK